MRFIILSISFFFSLNQTKEKIILKTHSGDSVIISKDIIYFNQRPISKTIEGIVYSSKYNRLIEQHSSILLILTKKMDIKVNGIYLKKPLDKEGNCCIVIKKTTKKSSR